VPAPAANFRRRTTAGWPSSLAAGRRRPADVDVAQFYGNWQCSSPWRMGFCAGGMVTSSAKAGCGGPTAGAQHQRRQLREAYIHGMENINETVRQVRGESTCQVADVELSLSVSVRCPGGAVCSPL
jgi:hypothetical protein